MGGKYLSIGELSEYWRWQTLCRLCFHLLFHFHQGNYDNQLYLAKQKWLAIFQIHVSNGTDAEMFLTSLLGDNKTLLDEYVDSKEVEQFISLIKKKGKHKR